MPDFRRNEERGACHKKTLGLLVIGFTVGGICGFVVHDFVQRFERLVGPIAGGLDDLGPDKEQFKRFVTIWNRYLQENAGFVPADPYKALVMSENIESFNAIRDIEFAPCLPVRLSEDPGKNPKEVLFWRQVPGLGLWIGFADGTWTEEITENHRPADILFWCRVMRRGGFPEWNGVRNKEEWLATNRNSLIWDPKNQVYVVDHAIDASRPTNKDLGDRGVR